ncbi:MAG TPA: alpha/beta hydrolase [Magnetospirillaceae bacterium]|jgi:alpha-beta hydrolase superfamily lysophospholipase
MMKPLAVILVVLGLAACSPTITLPGPSLGEAQLKPDAIIATDGARLPLRVWLPSEGEPKAVIVALHGFNDYSNAFALPSAYLTAHGVAVYAYDQRGFGEAPNVGEWAGAAAMSDDALTALRLVRAKYPKTPLFLMGESMGGAVAILTMTRPEMQADNAPHVSGVILDAPAVWARRRMTFIERSALWLSSHMIPWASLSGKGLNVWPSDNIAMLRGLSRDPLVIKETKVSALDGLVDLMDEAYLAAPKLRGPVLLQYGERDEIVPPKPTYDVMTALKDQPGITCAVYPKGYHMLLRDLHAESVLTDIVAWIDRPNETLPSGGDHLAVIAIAHHHAEPIGPEDQATDQHAS